jgi:hypothetical protein
VLTKYLLLFVEVLKVGRDNIISEPAFKQHFYFVEMGRTIERRLTNRYFRAQENCVGSRERRLVKSKMSYIRGYCYDITVVNTRAPTQVKRYYRGEGFIRKHSQNLMNSLSTFLEDISAKAGVEDILKPTIEKKSFHKHPPSNDIKQVRKT